MTSSASPVLSHAGGKRSRDLGRLCIALFAISTGFPIMAGVIPALQSRRSMGVADVTVALALVCAAIALASTTRSAVTDRDRVTALRWTHRVLALVPALLIVFFLAGERVDWEVLVIGLAWRGWLLIHTLPYLAAALTERAA